ncbi:MAG TPA: ribbon-helix-helix domain-containing protein [Myxococcota bacterium]|nr:ribbon-helix-helix domain-containing protein [Myxococcota bacterium]HOD08565.1 ribbon-helix-helix domain-containing protein [Myxococcota bacterium]HPB50135.1 ribbon-helix-helix domain-containing protein [Myxococcota bacterium]HQP95202.1 ribbon-helix-helix domain-containing protein [Myxococcota bacterium]
MSEVITFKVDDELANALRHVKNRSEFIRSALMAALDGTCPLCRGTGTLTRAQMQHWIDFSRGHELHECEDCHGVMIECGEECACGRADGPADKESR